jgi:hypothetical protein
MRLNLFKIILPAIIVSISTFISSQIIERERPQEWKQLIQGGRFIDRFLPMKGNVLSSDTWGADGVIPRYIDNGIEDRIWSYWGGNIKKTDDGKYHLFVCGWLESSPKGHMEWPASYVFNAISDNPVGPFRLRNIIGKGHNPEVFQLKDGRYVLYVINGRYITNDVNDPWEYGQFDFNPRDRQIIEGLSNLSFAQREDGSYIMVCRGGGIWISETGLSEYNQITDKRVYPDVDGRFEDPVIWRDHIQYHMIVNDWLGRIAFYLRSKDGIKWIVDPGEAYTPGIIVHGDGLKEDWFKLERIKVFQDKYGRAVQVNFAVIDTLKFEDKPFDKYSSKNIGIPLNPGLLLTMLDTKPINKNTKTIRVRIQAEEGFDPQTEIDIQSLRFGASTEVNYGRGCTVSKTENEGNDLIVIFNAQGNGITEEEFAPKLIGRSMSGKMLYGYARLPYDNYMEPILSARAPSFSQLNKGWAMGIEVQNFGQIASQTASLKMEYIKNGKNIKIGSAKISPLKSYEKTTLKLLSTNAVFEETKEYDILITISIDGKEHSTFSLKKVVSE